MAAKKTKLTVIGSSKFSRALAILADRSGSGVTFYDEDDAQNKKASDKNAPAPVKLPSSVKRAKNMKEACNASPLVFISMPSYAIRRQARRMGEFLTGDQVVIHTAKGLEYEGGELLRMSEVIGAETCVRKIGVLAGPSFAGEIIARQPAAAVIASSFSEVIEAARAAITNPTFQAFGNRDIVGVELAGALKRPYVIACGLAHGLGFGPSNWSLIASRGLSEMSRIGAMLGANPSTFAGLSGFGDLFASTASQLSPDFQYGIALGQGKNPQKMLEKIPGAKQGADTVIAAADFARKKRTLAPILFGVYDVVCKKQTAAQIVKRLIAFEAGLEMDLLIDPKSESALVPAWQPQGGEGKR